MQFRPSSANASNELFYATKNNGVVNVSVMHHPLDFIKDKKDIEKAMDAISLQDILNSEPHNS